MVVDSRISPLPGSAGERQKQRQTANSGETKKMAKPIIYQSLISGSSAEKKKQKEATKQKSTILRHLASRGAKKAANATPAAAPTPAADHRDAANTSRSASSFGFPAHVSVGADEGAAEEPSFEPKRSLFGECKNKSVVYNAFGDYPAVVLDVVDEPFPMYKPSDVLVKVQASTISLADCLHRRGMCFSVLEPICLPAVPGMDLVGVIKSVGSKVSTAKPGDRVAALVRTGGNAQYAVVPESSLVKVPQKLDSCEAICMVSTYMTAYQAIHSVIGKEETLAGKEVLVVGGMGPIGQALVELCKIQKAEKIFVTAPKTLHKYVKRVMGAEPLPMDPFEWLPHARNGMDVVFDGVCQDGFDSSKKALKPEGKLVCYGVNSVLSQEGPGMAGAPIAAHWARTKATWFMSRTVDYDLWDSFQEDQVQFKTDLKELFELLQNGKIKPHVAKRVALSDVADSHAFIEKGASRGAIICMPWKRLRGIVPPVPADREGRKVRRELDKTDGRDA